MTRLRLSANVLSAVGALVLAVPALHIATGVRSQSEGLASTRSATVEALRPLPAIGEAWARIELPRLGLDQVVFEGASADVLRKGPGHVPGTGCVDFAGRIGNCVIAGHRDSFFRRLASARAGDLVRLSGVDGRTASYRLSSRRIVFPDEVSVLQPSNDRRLTLITCFPFRWIGSAPYRLVWSAEPVENSAQR